MSASAASCLVREHGRSYFQLVHSISEDPATDSKANPANSPDSLKATLTSDGSAHPPNHFIKPDSRLLVIRLSSFGDIVQAVGVPSAFRKVATQGRVEWLVRSDFQGLLRAHPLIDKVLPFNRKDGLWGLICLAWKLGSAQTYTHLYDAHSNLRSQVFCLVYRLRHSSVRFVRRPKDRLRRWLFFNFRLPVLKMPFRGANSFHRPLVKWGLDSKVPSGPQFYTDAQLPNTPANDVARELENLKRPIVALAPSAAWPMKRWPIDHWKHLVTEMPEASFVLVGGPQDKFINDIYLMAPDRSLNLAGRLTLEQNAAAFAKVDLVIANDTGLLHVADQCGTPLIALIGPTAFGYPSHSQSHTVEVDLPCKPCSKDGRGGCTNPVYQRCLIDVQPKWVAAEARSLLLGRAADRGFNS